MNEYDKFIALEASSQQLGGTQPPGRAGAYRNLFEPVASRLRRKNAARRARGSPLLPQIYGAVGIDS